MQFKTDSSADRIQPGRVHTSSCLDDLFALDGKRAWLDEDTTAVSPDSIKAATAVAGNAISAVEFHRSAFSTGK